MAGVTGQFRRKYIYGRRAGGVPGRLLRMEDLSLVRKYVEDGDHQAFAQVVRRHVDLVYSAARRQVPDPPAADDVTQLVFMTLARKARALRPGCVLAAWLLSVTRNVALNANTASARRRGH